MKGYAIFVLHCAFYIAVQCHQHTQHNVDGPVYDGLNTVLSDAQEQTQMIANDLTDRLNQTFNSIREKVDSLKDNNAFTQEIESLKSQGDDVQKCLKEHELATAEFMRKLVNTYDSCAKEIKQQVNELVEKIQGNVTVVKGAPKRMENITNECYSEDEKNVAAAILCIVTRITEVQENVFEANHSVEEFFNQGVEKVVAYSNNKCEGIKDLKKEFDSLSGKIQTCVKKNKQ